MDTIKCLQCGCLNNNTSNRIIQDTCGHYKCRSCLFSDEQGCSTCVKIHKENSVNLEFEKRGKPISVICSTIKTKEIEDTGSNQTNETNYDEKKIKCISDEVVNSDYLKHSVLPFLKNENTSVENGIKASKKKLKFRKTKQIPLHVKTLGGENTLKYNCTLCGSIFKNERQISYHVYCGSEKPFSCSECSKKFVKKSQLTHHLNVHTGIRPFVCKICKASFFQKSKLITHGRIHNGKKSFKCSRCNTATYTLSALREHKLIHLESKPYSCHTCGAKFSHISNLKKHEATHLNLKFFCPTCNKKCHTKYYLKRHIKQCTAAIECEKCAKAFRSKKDRDRHMLIHSDFKKYKCSFCESSFRRKDNVIRHVRNSHPNINLEFQQSIFVINDEVRNKESIKKETDVKLNNKKSPKQLVNLNKPMKIRDVNDESYSLDKLYTKIFVYKAHESFIPVKPSNTKAGEVNNTLNKSVSKSNQSRLLIISAENVNNNTHNTKSNDREENLETETIVSLKYQQQDNNTSRGEAKICDDAAIENSEINFTKKDILEANEHRQSVIFNFNNTQESVDKNTLVPKQFDRRVIDNSTVLSCASGSHMKEEKRVDVMPLKNNIRNEPISFQKKLCAPKKNHDLENATSFKPIYLHKKVNYDQNPLYQQKKNVLSIDISKKLTANSNINEPEKKSPLKAELSELYKKILFTFNPNKSSSNIPPLVSVSDSSGASKSEGISKGLVPERKSKSKVVSTTPEHWRRRLAHSSEKD